MELEKQKKSVQAVQKLKHKQIALLLQSLADIQATVDEVTNAFTHAGFHPCRGKGACSSLCIVVGCLQDCTLYTHDI